MSMLDLLGLNRIFKAGTEVKPTRKILNFIGDGVTITDDEANKRTNITIDGGGGSGDGTVTGPETSTAGHVATYAGADGTELADGGVALADLATEQYVTDAIAAIPGGGTSDDITNESDVDGASVTEALDDLLAQLDALDPAVVAYHGWNQGGSVPVGPTVFTDVIGFLSGGAYSDGVAQGIARSGSSFTVSEGGTYYVQVTLNSYTVQTTGVLRCQKNGVTAIAASNYTEAGNGGVSQTRVINMHGLVQCNAGDVLRVQYANQSTAGGTFGSVTVDGQANRNLNITIYRVTATPAKPQIITVEGEWRRVVDTNFTQLPTAATPDGQVIIEGVKYQVSNNARASAFGIVNGTGWRAQCNASQSANYFLDASTGPVIAIKLRDICPDFVMGQSELRMWCLAGTNGNQNHENATFGFALYPWQGGTANLNWYAVLAFGAYDSLNPHNGIICGHGTTATPRVDKDLTAVTIANDPTRSVWGVHMRDVGNINFYTRSMPASVDNALANDAVTPFDQLSLRAQLKHSGVNNVNTGSQYQNNGVQALHDPIADWRVATADDVQLLIMAVSNYNTTAHMLATLKRLVVEYKP
jgi:hypothetical protein